MELKKTCLILQILSFLTPLSLMAQADDEPKPPFEKEKALRVMRLLGADLEGASDQCRDCHDPNMIKLNLWAERAQTTSWKCIDTGGQDDKGNDLPADPIKQVNCMREDPFDESSPFSVRKLGLFTAGAHLEEFKQIFKNAFGEKDGPEKHKEFVRQVGMPKQGTPFTEDEFKEIREWFTYSYGLFPFLEEVLGLPVDVPTKCEPKHSPEFQDYLLSRSTNNWEIRNQERGMRMFACPLHETNAKKCFHEALADGSDRFPEARDLNEFREWTQHHPEQKLRLLKALDFKTSYWMRSSADGRFIGNGLEPPESDGKKNIGNQAQKPPESEEDGYYGVITDLHAFHFQPSVRNDIKVRAEFDPGFFPDNSGFIFQGASAGFCQQAILLDPRVDHIDFSEPGCSKSGEIRLYQGIGTSLDGTDYLAITSTFQDDSGQQPIDEPEWLQKSYLHVNPIIHNGTTYEAQMAQSVWTPFLGDFTLSPSTELTAARIAGLAHGETFQQMGYQISHLSQSSNDQGEKQINHLPMATICEKGGKANFSFDERFLVTHRAIDVDDFAEFGFENPLDPGFAKLIGTHNIYLTDLLKNKTYRLTTVGEGQHAKYPHFRSDGWMYFLAMTPNGPFAMATDAAIRLKEQ